LMDAHYSLRFLTTSWHRRDLWFQHVLFMF